MRFFAHLRTRWPWLAWLVVLILLAAAFHHHHKREQQAKDFARELAQVRAAHQPTTAVELLAYYRSLPTGPDATDAWRAAFAAIGNLQPRQGFPLEGLPPRPEEPWPELAQMEAYLANNASALQAIDAALASSGDCLFIKDFDNFHAMVLRQVDGARAVQLMLLARAYVCAHRGDVAGAMHDIEGLFAVAETLRLEPMFVTQLVRRFMLRQNVETIQHLLVPGRFTDQQLAQLQEALAKIDLHPAMAIATLGERVAGLQYFENPADANLSPVPALVHRTWTEENPAQFMAMMGDFLEAAQTPWPEPLALTEKYHLMAVDDVMVRAPLGGSWFSPSKMGGAMRHNLVVSTARETARLRAAVVALGAVRFRQTTGRWPEALEELVPGHLASTELDPFTGGALLLRQTESGLVVYSVGVNEADDGGVESSKTYSTGEMERQGNPDVVFEIRWKR